MANSESASYGSVFWERLNNIFSLSSKEPHDEGEQPEHRGFVITMCIVFSVILWFFSSMSESYTKSFDIVTRVENLSENEAFVTLPPPSVNVMVKGDGLQLLQLYYNPPSIVIDANQSQLSVQEAVERRLPQNMMVERTLPAILSLQKEARQTKKVPIQPRAEISWPATHDIVQDIWVTPDSVELSGAQSILENITHWPTAFFEREDVKDTLDITVQLADTLKGLVALSISETRLSAVTAQFTEGTRDLDVHLNDVPSMQEYLTLDPPIIEVKFRVPLAQYQMAQDASDFLASVSYDALRDDTTGFIVPELVLPQGIWLRDVVMFPSKLRYYDVLLDE
ncbi:MAG: hypothetical protein AAF564_08845 [Bacteroidota bacterium]